jgi:hypothetical protein
MYSLFVWQTEADKKLLAEKGGIPIGIGKNSHIRRAIIDKNARIGDNVKVSHIFFREFVRDLGIDILRQKEVFTTDQGIKRHKMVARTPTHACITGCLLKLLLPASFHSLQCPLTLSDGFCPRIDHIPGTQTHEHKKLVATGACHTL